MRRARIVAATLALVLGLGVAPLAADGVAYRVKDLNTQDWTVWPAPGYPMSVGARAVFAMSLDYDESNTLWATDGTSAGTGMIRAIVPRSAGPPLLLDTGGALLAAYLPTLGDELWWTDGTIAGTRLVADINPGDGDSYPSLLGEVGGLALLAATEPEHGRELWASDGTAAGTRLVADIQPGPASGLNGPSAAGVVGGRLVFVANVGADGSELWASDGTATGTIRLRGFVPGPNGSAPAGFLAAGGLLYFAATDVDHGLELWATDGTPAGTRLVFDIEPGTGNSSPVPIADLAGNLFFKACDAAHGCEPWITDGTPAGTRLVLDIQPGPGSSTYGSDGAVAESSGRIVFAADDGIHGYEPWTSDGTAAGTALLADLSTGSWDSDPGSFFPFEGTVLFGAFVDDGTVRLFRTDGAAGVTELGQILAGGDEFWFRFARAGSDLVISAWWASYHWSGSYLWRTDGTVAGTSRIPLERTISPANIDLLAARPSSLVMTVEPDQVVSHLYRSDGTEAGTVEMTAAAGGGSPTLLAEPTPLADGELLFAEHPYVGSTCSLWRTDGDVYSVVHTYEPEYGFVQYCPSWLTRFGDQVFFAADDGVLGSELWTSDGTPNGTQLVRDIVPGFESSWPAELVADGDWFWFSATQALWQSAGTGATTFEYPLSVRFETGIGPIVPLGGGTNRIEFRAGNALWGLDSGTGDLQLLRSALAAWNGGPWPEDVLDGVAYFFDRGVTSDQCELWRTDATTAGTWAVRQVPCPDRNEWDTGLPTELVALGDRLFFPDCEASTGCELWTSDGTAAGTHLFADLDPGVFSSSPMDLSVVGDRLYFAACDAAAGCEPWVSDGSVAGTHRIDDIWPGTLGSLTDPRFTPWDRLVFFAADDGTGTELWAMPMELFFDGFETGDTSRWSP